MGWVEAQLQVQREVYRVDPPSLEGHDRARFLWDMVAAAKEELTEIRRCYDAKVYTGLRYSGETLKGRDHVLTELADLMCFVGNIASLEGFTTEELEQAHLKKIEQNRERHAR